MVGLLCGGGRILQQQTHLLPHRPLHRTASQVAEGPGGVPQALVDLPGELRDGRGVQGNYCRVRFLSTLHCDRLPVRILLHFCIELWLFLTYAIEYMECSYLHQWKQVKGIETEN